MDFCPRSRRP